jgi:hypothetical protein
MDNFKTRWKCVGFGYVLLATVITLSYPTCSCNSVKKIRNSSVAKSDSAHVHSELDIAVSKEDSNATETSRGDYDIFSVETPHDTSAKDVPVTIIFNDKKVTVPKGSTVKFEKGSITGTKTFATKNSDSIAHQATESTSVDKQSKTVSVNKETHRVSLIVIISLLIIGIIGLCLWDLHKNKPPFP